MKLIKIFIFFTLLLGMAFSQTADFLIVENPSELTIYNKYQQYISDQIHDLFVPFTPFRIIEENELLSDQITQASRVIYEDHVMFLLKDVDDQYIESNKNQYIKLFKNCDIYSDTIKILKNKRISIFAKPEQLYQGSQHTFLEEGQVCLRVFQFKNLFYLKLRGNKIAYGWTQLPRNGAWEISHQADIGSVPIPEKLISRLQLRIESINQDYENLFNYFNDKYQQDRVIPKWNLDISEKEIRGILNDPALATQLKNSNRYLMQDIDNIFLGSDFTPIFSDSIFTVRSKNNRQ